MLGDIRASLYDVFGFLLPGLVAAVALMITGWTVIHGTAPFPLELFNGASQKTMFVIMAYFVGHSLHAISNFLPLPRVSAEDTVLGAGAKVIGEACSTRLNSLIEETLGVADPAKLTAKEKFDLIDEARVWGAREGDRDVYVYREGFYRGSALAALLATLTCAWVTYLGSFNVLVVAKTAKADEILVSFSRVSLGFAVFLALCVTVMSYVRMKRFACYRVTRAAYRFIAIASSQIRNK